MPGLGQGSGPGNSALACQVWARGLGQGVMENGKKFGDELISLIRFLDKKNNKGDRID
jgi:hypothetical protein